MTYTQAFSYGVLMSTRIGTPHHVVVDQVQLAMDNSITCAFSAVSEKALEEDDMFFLDTNVVCPIERSK